MFEGVSYQFKDAAVLVTGGSNGIGRAIAQAYRDAGATVVITGRHSSASDYDHDLSGMDYRQLDVTDNGQIKNVVGRLERLDILVNNAGGRQYVHESEWDPSGFDAALAVNLSSVFRITDAAFDKLKASRFPGGASVLGISSNSAAFSFEEAPGYSAAKTAMIQLTKTYAATWAQYSIRANAIAPGIVDTNLTKTYQDNIAPRIAQTPIARIGQPNDIAAAALFLTSPAASWITGQTLVVDGGFTIVK